MLNRENLYRLTRFFFEKNFNQVTRRIRGQKSNNWMIILQNLKRTGQFGALRLRWRSILEFNKLGKTGKIKSHAA